MLTNTITNPSLFQYMLKSMSSYTDFWMIRKQFTAQLATTTFMTYIMSVAHRQPCKFFISRNNGNIWMTELLPGKIILHLQNMIMN